MPAYGYARVSTTDQDLTLQREALTRAGCVVIRAEKVSGTSRRGRTELRTILDFIGEGDALVVTRVDRLARSIGDLQDVVRAKAAGKCRGRKPSIDAERVLALHAEGMGPIAMAAKLSASRSTVWRVLRDRGSESIA